MVHGAFTAFTVMPCAGCPPVHLCKARAIACRHLQVFTSDHALKLDWIPDWIAIIGSGYIGLEFSDVYTALGSEVTFIEVRAAQEDSGPFCCYQLKCLPGRQGVGLSCLSVAAWCCHAICCKSAADCISGPGCMHQQQRSCF